MEQSPSTSWKIVPGLYGQGLSFESTDKPNSFLRQRDNVLFLDPYQNDDSYKKDACFKPIPGLAACDQITFKSVIYPDRCLRHKGGVIQLHQNDGSELFKKDATFKGKIDKST